MDWPAIGAFADIIAALGVIGSLIYVAIQVRQNTRSLNRASAQAIILSRTESARYLGNDVTITDLYWRGGDDPESLSEEEWKRYFWLWSATLRPVELAFLDHAEGNMEDKLWAGQNHALEFWFSKPGFERMLAEYGETLHPDFKQHVDRIVSEAKFKRNQAAHLEGQSRTTKPNAAISPSPN